MTLHVAIGSPIVGDVICQGALAENPNSQGEKNRIMRKSTIVYAGLASRHNPAIDDRRLGPTWMTFEA
jgi:hypothetical protein